jgi:hypothetical protein
MSALPASDSETFFIRVNFCEPVSRNCPLACTVGIYGHLEVPEQARRILDLINKDGRRMTSEKSARFLFGLLSLVGEVEGHKRMFREQAPEGGGLSGLSGSGQHD